jgi:membrane protein implicated in regulation of membrane protease activity
MSDDWWVDQRQNRRIAELQTEVEAAYTYAASRSRALQSRLSQVQGTLERRLDRLAKSFDAFVELSDLRLDLAMFDRESAVRNRTRRLLMGLAQGAENPPPLDLDDCPGYWLKPAAEALAALIRGDDEDGEKFAAQAAERDADRTTLFLTLGLAVAGRYSEAVPWLAQSLPALGSGVTTVQRRLWIACADGAFGEPGRTHIERRLTEVLDEMPQDASVEQRVKWGQVLSGGGGGRGKHSLPRELQSEKSLLEPPVAAESLARLRARVEQALRPADVQPAADFATLLNTLVDEGSPQERPLVTRARELRQIIESGGAGAEQPAAWDAPAGDTLDLLRGDMFERGGPGTRALAARVGASWLNAVADGLLERATVRPPDRVNVRVYGHALRVGADGSADLPEAQAAIDDAAEQGGPGGEWFGLALTGGGVVVVVLTILARLTGLAVVGGVVAIAGVMIWAKLRSDRLKAREAAEHDKNRLAGQVTVIADTLKESHTRHKELITRAQADREAILTLLA